jgi:hypothetical protein
VCRALGRGHHGGGDWADGWDLPKLRTVMAMHYGFENPTQCVKYLLGSHDQIGCANGGAWYRVLPLSPFAAVQFCCCPHAWQRIMMLLTCIAATSWSVLAAHRHGLALGSPIIP